MFPSEVQAPRTKLIKWKINDCLRLIGKGVLQRFYCQRLSEMMSCCGDTKVTLCILEIFCLFGLTFRDSGLVFIENRNVRAHLGLVSPSGTV